MIVLGATLKSVMERLSLKWISSCQQWRSWAISSGGGGGGGASLFPRSSLPPLSCHCFLSLPLLPPHTPLPSAVMQAIFKLYSSIISNSVLLSNSRPKLKAIPVDQVLLNFTLFYIQIAISVLNCFLSNTKEETQPKLN